MFSLGPWELLAIAIIILYYIYFAVALQTIAQKTDTQKGWLAWIPIANIYLMCVIAKRPTWWVILIIVLGLIPYVGIISLILLAIVWMDIAATRNKPSWIGILVAVPIVNIFVVGIITWSDKTRNSAEFRGHKT